MSRDTVAANARRYGFEALRTRVARWSGEDQRTLEVGVWEYLQKHPQAGLSIVVGYLRFKNILHTFDRVRKYMRLLQLVQPEAVSVKASYDQIRLELPRVYSVAAPNLLWHHDGQHGLVKHGFVTHAFIDSS